MSLEGQKVGEGFILDRRSFPFRMATEDDDEARSSCNVPELRHYVPYVSSLASGEAKGTTT